MIPFDPYGVPSTEEIEKITELRVYPIVDNDH